MGGASRWQTRENDELRHLGPPTAGNDDPPAPLENPWIGGSGGFSGEQERESRPTLAPRG